MTSRRCESLTKEGKRCKNDAVGNSKYCYVHKSSPFPQKKTHKKKSSKKPTKFANSGHPSRIKYRSPLEVEKSPVGFMWGQPIPDDDAMHLFPNPPTTARPTTARGAGGGTGGGSTLRADAAPFIPGGFPRGSPGTVPRPGIRGRGRVGTST